MKLAQTLMMPLLLMTFVSPALATDVDLRQFVLDAAGQPMRDCDHVNRDHNPPICDKWTVLTLGRVAAAVLDQADNKQKLSDIVERGNLVLKIRAAENPGGPGQIDLTDHELDLIRAVLDEHGPKIGLTNSQFVSILRMLPESKTTVREQTHGTAQPTLPSSAGKPSNK